MDIFLTIVGYLGIVFFRIRAIVETQDHQDFITDDYHHWKVFGLFNSFQS